MILNFVSFISWLYILVRFSLDFLVSLRRLIGLLLLIEKTILLKLFITLPFMSLLALLHSVMTAKSLLQSDFCVSWPFSISLYFHLLHLILLCYQVIFNCTTTASQEAKR